MVEDDIKKASEIIENGVNRDNYFSQLYSFSNENLNGYIGKIDFSGKDVLTCGSSADQLLNIINNGCRNVSLFDINPFTKYYYDLKVALIKNVDVNNYIAFLGYKFFNINEIYDKVIYKNIRKDLCYESRMFWDSLFYKYGFVNVKRNLFVGESSLYRKNIIANNSYLHKGADIIRLLDYSNVSFYVDNLDKLSKIDGKYDYIFLSNIIDYLYKVRDFFWNEEEYFENISKCKDMLKRVSSLLKENGEIYFYYIWHYHDREYVNIFEKHISVLPEFKKKFLVDSDHFYDDCDCVYVYKKIK